MRVLAPLSMLAALLTLLGSTTAAHAATVSPPGNSGLSQYLEVVPTAGGGKPSNKSKSAKSSPLSKRQQQKLSQAGDDGRQLAAVVAGTAPDGAKPVASAKKKAKKRRQGKPKETVALVKSVPAEEKHKSAMATAFTSNGGGSGDGGLGIPLLAPMIGTALLVGAFALGRRRGAAGKAPTESGPEA